MMFTIKSRALSIRGRLYSIGVTGMIWGQIYMGSFIHLINILTTTEGKKMHYMLGNSVVYKRTGSCL